MTEYAKDQILRNQETFGITEQDFIDLEHQCAEWSSRKEHVDHSFLEDSYIEGDWYTSGVITGDGFTQLVAWYWQPYPECVEVEELDQLDWTVDHYEIL